MGEPDICSVSLTPTWNQEVLAWGPATESHGMGYTPKLEKRGIKVPKVWRNTFSASRFESQVLAILTCTDIEVTNLKLDVS